ncbi:dolichol phosphate-mannose biosynthesis regulatory [Umbelopsis sp. PMI_123]|nr:dolichol phosphate-mannose biosynthesis regulatory [Umbelopsis sp. PMI_123]
MANGKDKAVGAAAFSIAVTVFVYYTTWALIMPFVDEDHPLHNYFPPDEYRIRIPLLILVVGLTAIFSFLALVMIKSKSKKTKKSN